MFTRMMLKSMRDAVGPDPMFGSDQEQMYQGMYDDQLSLQLSKGKGLGLADMLVRQLQKMGVKPAPPQQAAAARGARRRGRPRAPRQQARRDAVSLGAEARRARNGRRATAYSRSASDAPRSKFHSADLWPQAQEAGQQLGVDPRNLIAQAALETNWGRNLPQDAAGGSSNNLFGVKAPATGPAPP